MYNFVFVRHGRSLADDENKHEGRYDSPLTNVGEKQAGLTAQKFKKLGYEFDTIIASPLKRTSRTAEIINKEYAVDIIKQPLWMEVDNGLLAGKLKNEETDKMFPVPKNGFGVYDRRANGTGESRAQLYSRAILAVEDLVSRPEGNYLVVAHGCILNIALQFIFGAKPTSSWEGDLWFSFGDNGFIELCYGKEKNTWGLKRFDSGIDSSTII